MQPRGILKQFTGDLCQRHGISKVADHRPRLVAVFCLQKCPGFNELKLIKQNSFDKSRNETEKGTFEIVTCAAKT